MEGCCLQVQERIVFHAPFVQQLLLQLSPFLRDWYNLLYSPTYGSPVLHLWSETPSFKRLPLHRWVLDHYHLYCKHT